MMKKKTHNPVKAKQKNLNEATDNKENTLKPQNNNGRISDIPPSGDSTESAPEGCICTGDTADNIALEVRVVEEKLAEMQDKYIRLSAEFDNYRKRTLREKMELSKYAGENLLLKIIPLMDDFERALKLMDTVTDGVAMKNGIDLIYSKFSEFLKQNGIKEIESLNSNFNVNLHEAVAKVPVADDDKKGKVVDVVLKGYYLQDKVLRFSKVVVGE
ncbi:MAG: nucleotide exchange factor GrpE [Bacteroidia bacterium]|nr:nucleotide exchange factor GrpE [Bacteroidia bacterium]